MTMIELWSPHRRCLGEVCLGDTRQSVVALGGFFEDSGDDPDDQYLRRFSPDLTVALSDDVVVSIAALDECLVDGVNLIGLPLEAVEWRLGGIAEQTDHGEVDMFNTTSGVEVWVRDGVVCQVHISDWSLVKELESRSDDPYSNSTDDVMLYHVSSAANRESILMHGLNWSLMRSARGIAGSSEPEVEGVFLCRGEWEANWIIDLNNTGGPIDVWTVEGVGMEELIESQNGFAYIARTIRPEQLTLIRRDVPPGRMSD